MTLDDAGARQRWLAAAIGALVLAGAAGSIFRKPTIESAPLASPAPPLELKKVTAENGPLAEEALMRDLAPLFLPTERNASLARVPTREPGKTFLDAATPNLGVAGSNWRINEALPPIARINGKPAGEVAPLDLLHPSETELSLGGFGRTEAKVPALATRGAIVDVTNLRDGRRQPPHEITADLPPAALKGWQPVEFTAAVGAAGLVGQLTLVATSGSDEVDRFLRIYLARSFRVGERLAPGFYRITVTP